MFRMMVLFVSVVFGYEPCQYEDSFACYWLADEMGNGTGRSFIIGPELGDTGDFAWIVYDDKRKEG